MEQPRREPFCRAFWMILNRLGGAFLNSFLSTLISDQKIRSHPFPPPETLQLKPGTRVEGVGSEGARATWGLAEPAAVPSGDACSSKSGRTPQPLCSPLAQCSQYLLSQPLGLAKLYFKHFHIDCFSDYTIIHAHFRNRGKHG